MNRLRVALCLLLVGTAGCSPTRFFYYPNNRLYADPEKLGLPYELVSYPSENGKTLYGIFFETAQEPKGIVVHFHGNFGNVSSHFLQSQFLTRHGFDVLVFDYEGYGGSDGTPTPERTIEDGIASVRWAAARNRGPKGAIGIFGQSLGGAVATAVAARDARVRAVVLEGTFSSYRAIARDVLERSVITWLLVPIYPWFIGTAHDPEKLIGRVAPRPVLLIHGDADHIVPSWMSQRLYDRAQQPKELWIVPGAGHLECRLKAKGEYEERIAEFFTKTLSGG